MKERLNRFLDTLIPYSRLALPCVIVVLGAVVWFFVWFFWTSLDYPVTVNGIQDGDTLCGLTGVEVLVPKDGPNELGKDLRLSVDGKFVPYNGPDPQIQYDGLWDEGRLVIEYGIDTQLFQNGLHTVTVTYGWRNERYHVFFQNPVPKRAQKG